MEGEIDFIRIQFKFAVDARDKLNDNFYKWMSYFYFANAGVLVAITSIFIKDSKNNIILLLSLIGLFICILWNLSCKGYYYWSKSWMDIIMRYEKLMSTENKKFEVFSIFSKEVAEMEDSFWRPTKPGNVSTPKLTLLFSLFSIFCWSGFTIYEFCTLFPRIATCWKISISSVFFVGLILVYGFLIPRKVKSRDLKSHKLVQCRHSIF